MLELNVNKFKINNKIFSSRLLIGSGKFANNQEMLNCIKSSESELVTVAIRRVDLAKRQNENIAQILKKNNTFILANTSGAKNSDEAVFLAKLAYEMGLPKWIKLEIHPDPKYLLPDPIETLKASEVLVKEGFTVLPYINADPVLAKRLEEVGTATVMPLASPIGSNQGMKMELMIKIIIEQANVPVIVDAGLGSPSHASKAMEIGADAVLVNTAIASSKNPSLMAEAFKQAVEAGRKAYLAGLANKSQQADATSLTSFLS